MTKKQFQALSPWRRGYAVYMCGSRPDEPNVPDESDPYRGGSRESRRWNEGQRAAILAVIDGEE